MFSYKLSVKAYLAITKNSAVAQLPLLIKYNYYSILSRSTKVSFSMDRLTP